MGSLFRTLFYLAVFAAGILLVAEIHAHRRSPTRAEEEIRAAMAESAATISLAPPTETFAPPVVPSPTRPRPNGTTALGIAAALGVLTVTVGVLYRLST